MPFAMRADRRVPKLLLALLGSTALVATGLLPTTEVAAATTTTKSLAASAATYTNTKAATKQYASSSIITVNKTQYRGYVQFDTSGVDLKSVVKAELLLTTRSVSSAGKKLRVRSAATSSVAGLTANAAPAVSTTIGTSATLKKGKRFAVNLTSLSALKRTTVLALNLTTAGKATFYKTGTRAPALRLTTSVTVAAPPSVTPTPTPTPTPKPTPTPTPTPEPTTETTTGTTNLAKPAEQGPIDLPAVSTHKKLVFAHYFPPYPVSIENAVPTNDYYVKHYLNPDGENGKFAAWGGLLRDRPIPSDPVSGDFKLANLKTEVRQAMAAGIDGFAVDILNTTGSNWEATLDLIDAAESVSSSFKIMLQPDMTASTGALSASDLAAKLAPLASRSGVYKLSDGRVVISPFKGEAKTVAWWQDFLNSMSSRGAKAAFFPVFVGASANVSKYASISYGMGDWGVRNPANVLNGPNYADQAHGLGKKWMASVAVQDTRPTQEIYDEAANTELLRATWSRAIDDGADFVLLTTWNDYSESTSFAPSRNHGFSVLDINAYYQSKFQTGSYQTIKRDTLFVTHRIHKHALKPTDQSKLMVPWPGTGRTAPRDTVEVLSFLTSPATVTLTVGGTSTSYSAPAGVSSKTVSLATGSVSAKAVRSGSTVAQVTSHVTVKSSITRQDLNYYFESSGRSVPRQ